MNTTNPSSSDSPASSTGETSSVKSSDSAVTAAVQARSAQETTTKRTYPWYIEIPVVVIVALLITGLFQSFIGRVYEIPSSSMENTLFGSPTGPDDRIFVDKLSYRFNDPQPGDVLVFAGPASWNTGYRSTQSTNPVLSGVQNVLRTIGVLAPDENALVKRVIATGGQTVQCLEGDPGVMVDGKLLDESSYVKNPPHVLYPETFSVQSGHGAGSAACGGEYFGPITVPEGNLWMMGDNRTNSADSRFHIGDEFQGTVPEENVVGKVQWVIWPLNRIGKVHAADIA